MGRLHRPGELRAGNAAERAGHRDRVRPGPIGDILPAEAETDYDAASESLDLGA